MIIEDAYCYCLKRRTSSHLLKEADLITEKKEGKNRLYSLNRKTTSDLVRFFDDMYDYKLKSLKEYVENKEGNKANLYTDKK